ncbi:MAG: hypothetical protein KDB88_07010, partial [Flavobacteriales bacterium]|nr:hypothetical protein [Flavobacteriales bacterium]
MKMTRNFLTGLLLLGTLFAMGQDDPKSKAILDRLVAKSKTYTSFEADFTSRLVNKADKLDVSQTSNVKTKDGKFRVQLQ